MRFFSLKARIVPIQKDVSFFKEELESKKFKEAVRKFHKIFKLNESEKLVNCNFA